MNFRILHLILNISSETKIYLKIKKKKFYYRPLTFKSGIIILTKIQLTELSVHFQKIYSKILSFIKIYLVQKYHQLMIYYYYFDKYQRHSLKLQLFKHRLIFLIWCKIYNEICWLNAEYFSYSHNFEFIKITPFVTSNWQTVTVFNKNIII